MQDQIDDIIRENKIHRFLLELQHTKCLERKEHVKQILNSLQYNFKNINEGKNKMDELQKEMCDSALKKSWARLSHDQRNDRINEFVNRTIKDKNIKNMMLDKFIDMLENGELKNNYVIYDKEIGSIESIELPVKKPSKTSKK